MKTINLDILELLGEGGQGRVFKAIRRDPISNFSQVIAIKVLHSENAVDLWKSEFESLSRVRSPFCLQVYAFDRLDGCPALHLEYVEGVSLTELGRGLLLDSEDIEELLAQMQEGLRHLQDHGIHHGDLSPNNVLVDITGTIRLLDFGLANSSDKYLRLTPDFCAPERLRGELPSIQSDLSSLGRIEQYLLGEDLNSVNTSGYLKLAPEERCFRSELSPVAERRRTLGKKVAALLQRRKLKDVATQTFENNREVRPSARLSMLGLIFCLITGALATRGAASARQLSPTVVLTVSTQAWHKVSIDGVAVGYTPLRVYLEPGSEHVIRWTSAKGSGERRIKIDSDQPMHLGDRDFSH
jgi:serine/threonine protein kinase